MNDEFENALAWFQSAPSRWMASAKKDLSACAEWIWGVLQGDFNDDATAAQTATSTVISMIPFVDQICDVRDVVANCRKINSEPRETWHWIALILTLIGLFPTLGSLLKGCGKVMFASIRKAAHVSGAAPQVGKAIEAAISQLNKFLARPEVRKSLKALKIDNPYKYLSVKIRELSAQLSKGKLLTAFDEAKNAAKSLLDLVKKWGGDDLGRRAGALLSMIDSVRRMADEMLGKALKPVQDILNQLARRLDIEADMAHRAYLKTVNPHVFSRTSLDEERDAIARGEPSWVTKTKDKPYMPLAIAPSKSGWPNIQRDNKRGRHPLDDAYRTFHTIEPKTFKEGEVLYRIVDPGSFDNSICWMSKSEFEKLKGKADWRKRFAVWAHWNTNGEFITYTVPPSGLNAWEGITASQKLDDVPYVLEGGARQIIVDPSALHQEKLGPRRPTGWGYNEFKSTSLIGVPILKNNWK